MSKLQDERDRIGEYPDTDLEARVRHTLKVYEHEDDERVLVTATQNVYGPHVWTGLNWGDLRALAERAGIELP